MQHIEKSWQQIKFPVSVFFFWRLGLFFVGYISLVLLPFKKSFPYLEVLTKSGLPPWLWSWGNFDGVYYLRIAEKGYEAGEQVFFPLLPILIHYVHFFLPNYFLAGFIVSNLFALITAIALFTAVTSLFSREVAKWTILFLFAFPSSFFLGAVYPESLLLACVIIAFISTGVTSALFSFFAGTTKLIGVLLSLSAPFRPRKLFLGAAGIGLVIYMLYLSGHYHDPLSFLSAQSYFKNNRSASLVSLVTPVQVTYRYIRIFQTVEIHNPAYPLALLEFASFIFGLVALSLLTVRKKFPLSWLIFSWASFLLPTLTGTFQSLPRYLLVVFPIYIFFAEVKPILRLTILLIFIGLQFVLTILFLRGYFVA